MAHATVADYREMPSAADGAPLFEGVRTWRWIVMSRSRN